MNWPKEITDMVLKPWWIWINGEQVFERLGPSLYDFLRKNNYRSFPIALVREVAKQLLECIACVCTILSITPPALPCNAYISLALHLLHCRLSLIHDFCLLFLSWFVKEYLTSMDVYVFTLSLCNVLQLCMNCASYTLIWSLRTFFLFLRSTLKCLITKYTLFFCLIDLSMIYLLLCLLIWVY